MTRRERLRERLALLALTALVVPPMLALWAWWRVLAWRPSLDARVMRRWP